MADKSVGELIAAQSVTPTDLFVLEQNGTAKKLTGQVLENWLVSFADGHGGIHSIEKLSTSGLADTYRITLADTTFFDFVVTNGRSVNSITKTSASGLVDTYTIRYNNGTTSTFTVTNGEKGDKGDTAYIWIKYASQEPTVNSNSFGDVPDDWIGVYFGFSSTAPTDWKQYKWYRIKGEKGEKGEAATLLSSSVTYQVSGSGTIIPSGSWNSSIPVVPQGKYLWTRTVNTFNTGDPVTSYSVSRQGIDGSGSVSSVANISPDENGNVSLTAENVGALPNNGGDLLGELRMNGQPISGLNPPVSDEQAANKGYVDQQVKKAAPRNLLDNSDFRDPVNQRGQASYTGASDKVVYTIDRWFYSWQGTDAVLTVGDGYIQKTQKLWQYINPQKVDPEKTYTIALCMQDGTKYVYSGILKSDFGAWDTIWVGLIDGRLYVEIGLNVTGPILWIALYEGEYTLGNLPEYRPKGYAAELAECQRYYQIRSTNNIPAVDMRPLMRLENPTITEISNGYAYSADL